MKCSIKRDPSSLPKPKLPPTRPVDLGNDKMTYIPAPIKEEPPKRGWSEEPPKRGWSAYDERMIKKLKLSGVKDKDIAKRLDRTLASTKWKIKDMRRKGVL